MARDYKNAGRTTKSKKAAKPGSWLSFVSGLGLGLFVAIFVYFKGDVIETMIDDDRFERANEVETFEEPFDASTEMVEIETPKPQFEFYKILPEIEVKVPEWELEENERSEDKPISGSYVLQVGSFQAYEDADRAKARLALQGIVANIQRVVINGQDVWYRVHVGPYSKIDEINAMRERLASQNTDFILLKIGAEAPM